MWLRSRIWKRCQFTIDEVEVASPAIQAALCLLREYHHSATPQIPTTFVPGRLTSLSVVSNASVSLGQDVTIPPSGCRRSLHATKTRWYAVRQHTQASHLFLECSFGHYQSSPEHGIKAGRLTPTLGQLTGCCPHVSHSGCPCGYQVSGSLELPNVQPVRFERAPCKFLPRSEIPVPSS